MDQEKKNSGIGSDEGGATKAKGGKRKYSMWILNGATALVVILAIIFTIEAFYVRKHIYNNFLGYSVLPIKTDSMDAKKPTKGSFKKGSLVFIKILKDKDKNSLEVGDVIAFLVLDAETDTRYINVHRIIDKTIGGYITMGDKAKDIEEEIGQKQQTENVNYKDVIGVFRGKIGGIGNIGLFMETRVGSFVMIVVPFLFLLFLSIFYFIGSLRIYGKEKFDDSAESLLLQEKEKMRLEILAELEKEKKKSSDKEDK